MTVNLDPRFSRSLAPRSLATTTLGHSPAAGLASRVEDSM